MRVIDHLPLVDISKIDTPALVIELDALESNIRRMSEYSRRVGCNVRPHIKVHKTPAIAHKQIAAGAIGVTCAKVGEADVMVSSGVRDVLIANQIVGSEKVGRLVGLARHADVKVAMDDPSNAEEISREAIRRGASVGAVIEVDTGMGRAGVPPGRGVVSLARKIKSLKGLEFKGVMGYEGHLQTIETFEARKKAVEKSLSRLTASAKTLEEEKIDCEIVSAGGTNTYNIAAEFQGVTEIQAGSYVFMDVEHDVEGIDFEHSLTVLSTVTSIPGKNRAIIDAGMKCFGAETMPRAKTDGVKVKFLSEEHGWLETDGTVEIALRDKLEFYPYYAPFTVNLYDRFYCVRSGRVEVQWDILGRGKSQ